MLQANPFAEKAKTTIVAGAQAGRPTLFSMLVVNHAVYRERFNLRKFLGPFDEGVGAGVLAKPNGARKLKAAFRAGQQAGVTVDATILADPNRGHSTT